MEPRCGLVKFAVNKFITKIFYNMPSKTVLSNSGHVSMHHNPMIIQRSWHEQSELYFPG